MNIPDTWRTPLAVTVLHAVVIAIAFLLKDSDPPPARPEGVKVTLAAMPGSAAETPRSQPDTQPRPTVRETQPTSPNVRPNPQKNWRMRTPEEIRKGLTVEEVNTPRSTRTGPSENRELNNLVDAFQKETHATSRIGEPVAISDAYASRVQEILYKAWNQPTRAEVPTANQSVGIRLVIERDGRLTGKKVTQRSKSLIMNQSVKAMLNALTTFPPLPENYAEDQLRLDITLRLQ